MPRSNSFPLSSQSGSTDIPCHIEQFCEKSVEQEKVQDEVEEFVNDKQQSDPVCFTEEYRQESNQEKQQSPDIEQKLEELEQHQQVYGEQEQCTELPQQPSPEISIPISRIPKVNMGFRRKERLCVRVCECVCI